MKHSLNTLIISVSVIILISVFTGIVEAANTSSSIEVTDTGHYFEDESKPVFLLGVGNWIILNEVDVDYAAHNQWYQSYGINYNRITLTSTWYTDRSKQVFPWNRSTTPGANDGGNKFDLTEWDPVFWDRLNGYLQDCEDKGIIVCIQFFDECSIEQGNDPHRWDYHPFNPQNNINNIPDLNTTDASYSSSTGWTRSFYNVNNSVLMALQDIYVQKLLDETSQYGNVIYEIANEYGGEGDTQFLGHFAWPQHWVAFFSSYETANGVQLLLTNMPFGVDYDQAEYFASSGIDVIDAYRQFPSYDDIQGVNDFLGAHYNKGKPVFAGKIGNDISNGGNVDENRKRLWTLFVSGGAGSGLKGSDSADWADDTTMEEMLFNLQHFVERVHFWDMTPRDDLVKPRGFTIWRTAYCLANEGREYIIYLPNSGPVTVDLSDATGTFEAEWYDPRNGIYTPAGTAMGGGKESFTPPFRDDAVLHLVPTVFDTGEGICPAFFGTHNGSIVPTEDITVSRMYTYPCPETKGHTEYINIWNASGTVADGNWTGYEGDWQNISFDKSFTLEAHETYNYTIRTGSYPQMIHKSIADVTGGTITCEEFVDANGTCYNDWLPAIKLYSTEQSKFENSIEAPIINRIKAIVYNLYKSVAKLILALLKQSCLTIVYFEKFTL